MKKATLLIVLLFFSLPAMAMEKEEFDPWLDAIKKQEYENVEKFLKENKTKLAKDPDYYVLLLNYSYSKGVVVGIVVGAGEGEKGDLVLADPETGEQTGFLGERKRVVDKELIISAIRATQNAIEHFQDRLDIHLGIAYFASEQKEWKIVEEQLISLLEVSVNIETWKWGYVNSMPPDPKAAVLDNIQKRCYQLFQVNSPQTDEAYKNISRALTRLYPDHIYGYANMGHIHLASGELDQAEEYYKQALQIDPADEIVLHNLEILKKKREARAQAEKETEAKPETKEEKTKEIKNEESTGDEKSESQKQPTPGFGQ